MAPPQRRKGGKSAKMAKSIPRQVSAEDLYMEAEMAYISDELDRARVYFQRALSLEPDNAEFLDGYGAFLAECGPIDEAISVLQRACEASPSDGFEKFMYLGQVLDQEGRSLDAENSMRRGITILRKELESAREGPDAEDTGEATKEAFQEALCSALCSLAELLMGVAVERADEADDEAAAAAPALEEADSLLQEARNLWPSSPEPLQALASLRQVQGNNDEAMVLLQESMSKWYRNTEDVEKQDLEDEDSKGGSSTMDQMGDSAQDMELSTGPNNGIGSSIRSSDIQEETRLPSYEFRFETAKLLLELDETTSTAVNVLEELLEENDGVPDVWLLLAVAHRAGGELDEAAEAARKGTSVAKKLGLPSGHEVAAALEELGTELESLGIGDSVPHDKAQALA